MDRFLVSKVSRPPETLEPSVVIVDDSKDVESSKKVVPSRSAAEIFQSFKAKDKAKEEEILKMELVEKNTQVTEVVEEVVPSSLVIPEIMTVSDEVERPSFHKSNDSKSVSIKSLLTGVKQPKRSSLEVGNVASSTPSEIIHDLSIDPEISIVSPTTNTIMINIDDDDDAISITDEKTVPDASHRLKYANGKFGFPCNGPSSSIDLTKDAPTIFRTGKQLKVTLRISPEKLEKFRGLNITPKKRAPMNSFFAEVAERAKRESALSKSAILPQEKQKNMDLPVIRSDQFLVRDRSVSQTLFLSTNEPLFFDRFNRKSLTLNTEEIEKLKSLEELKLLMREDAQYRNNSKVLPEEYKTQILLDFSPSEISSTNYSSLLDARMQRLLQNSNKFREDTRSQWCDLFSPHFHGHILQPNSFNEKLNNWFNEAFISLKKIDKSKRKEKLKGKKKKSVAVDDSMYGFIDFDEEESEDETFVPSLILEGPTGSGKTSAVYASIRDELDGHIFELNSSQDRSKKAINFHLKQIATTLRVRDNIQENKDVVLLDDVDSIDLEEDKEFWSSVLELLSHSYRPVVFTTSNASSIPENVLQESTVLKLKRAKKSTLSEYVGIAAICMGYDIDMDILQKICTRDVRSSLLQLQMFCYRFEHVSVGILKIQSALQEKTETNDAKTNDIKENDITLTTVMEKHESLENLLATYHAKVSTTRIESDEHRRIDLGLERLKYADFVASKLFSIGSRKRSRYYRDGIDIIEEHPTCSFNIAANSRFFSEITPFIKEMAKVEQLRVEHQFDHSLRRFDTIPKEIFQDL